MTKKAKGNIFMVILFSLLAIVVAVVYSLHLIKSLDKFLAITNMAYLVGIAMMYLGSYQKEKGKFTAMRLCYFASIILILVAVAFLVYGLVVGEISLFL